MCWGLLFHGVTLEVVAVRHAVAWPCMHPFFWPDADGVLGLIGMLFRAWILKRVSDAVFSAWHAQFAAWLGV